MNLNEKLLKLKSKLPYFQKIAEGFNFKYVPGIVILTEIQNTMHELQLLLYPSVENPTISTIEGYKDVYNRKTKLTEKKHFINHTICASGYYIWEDVESKETKKVPWIFTADKEDLSQAFGTALTYSERYFLMKFFNIPTDEMDADTFINNQNKKKGLEPTQIKEINEKMSMVIKKDDLDIFWGYINQNLKTDYEIVQDVRLDDFNWIVKVLDKKIKDKADG
jgi:putative SOS response-associated peptidase YedK